MATFDVNANSRKVQSTANGSTDEFSFSFQVNQTSDIKVFVDGTQKTESTHYNIKNSSNAAGLNTDGTGKVVFTTGNTPANESLVSIKSDVPKSRTSVYTSGGNIVATSLESDFDTITMQLGDNAETINRSLKAPVEDPDNVDMDIPKKADRLDKVLAFNSSTGNPEVRDYLTLATSAAISGVTAGTVSASKFVQVDANKDVTGFRNVTITGELDAATLDVSGDVDIDGTLEADAITVNGTTLAETISDTVGAMVSSNTETGLSVTYDDSDNTLDFEIGSQSITNSMLADDAVGADELASSAVVTDSIVDDAVTLDKMAGLARGKIIVGDASGNPVALALGTSGQVLKSDGTDLVFGTQTASPTALDDLTAGDAATTLRTTAGNITIKTEANDTDIILEVDDAGTQVTGLKIDGSEAAQVQLPNDAQALAFGADQDVTLTHNHNVGLTLNSKDLSGVTSINNQSFGTRNYILNPEFAYSQRGTTINSTTPTSGSNSHSVAIIDMYRLVSDGDDIVDIAQTQTEVPSGSKTAIELLVPSDASTTNKKFGIVQFLENVNCESIIGQEVTLSAQIKATSDLDDCRMSIISWSGDEDLPAISGTNFISAWESEGTNPTLATNYTYENTPADLNVTTSYAKYSVTATIDTSNTKNVAIFIWSNVTGTTAGTSKLRIGQVQLEKGSVATSFNFPEFSAVMESCRRYLHFQVGNGGTTQDNGVIGHGHFFTTAARLAVPLTTPMRVAPTVTGSGINYLGPSSGSATGFASVLSTGGNITTMSFNITFSTNSSMFSGSSGYITSGGGFFIMTAELGV